MSNYTDEEMERKRRARIQEEAEDRRRKQDEDERHKRDREDQERMTHNIITNYNTYSYGNN